MDYSIYDAIQAGFGKIVWVIRKDFEEQFRTQILSKYEGHIPCELCFQGLDSLPEGFSVPEGRQKPWGTNHAVLMGKDVIKEPFCVINCDDFYNRDAFMVIGKYLANLPEGARNQYAMVGFRVGNTLSENGTTSLLLWSVQRSCVALLMAPMQVLPANPSAIRTNRVSGSLSTITPPFL